LKKIIISRTDNLGDVMLTLPLSGYLKSIFPECEVHFIGKSYTEPLIKACQSVDFFWDTSLLSVEKLASIHADAILFIFPDKALSKLAKQAKIPIRVGTSHRWWHWLYCNRLVNFSRKKSLLHESQLNFKLLKGLHLDINPTESQIIEWYRFEPPKEKIAKIELPDNKFKIILHPKSKGSAREWSMKHYFDLAQKLPTSNFQIYVTGTEIEGSLMLLECPELFNLNHIINLCGKCSLAELVIAISQVDALLACSTGPLHIASALGIHALGIYPPIKPMDPKRWKPIGKNAWYWVVDKQCSDCRKSQNCTCINEITTNEVYDKIMNLYEDFNKKL